MHNANFQSKLFIRFAHRLFFVIFFYFYILLYFLALVSLDYFLFFCFVDCSFCTFLSQFLVVERCFFSQFLMQFPRLTALFAVPSVLLLFLLPMFLLPFYIAFICTDPTHSHTHTQREICTQFALPLSPSRCLSRRSFMYLCLRLFGLFCFLLRAQIQITFVVIVSIVIVVVCCRDC